jgi:PTH1 family peptidyl-tRNA hydrolase
MPVLMPDACCLTALPMKLIVGLGNPGSEYTRTRHNAGFMVVDRLVGKHAAGAIPKARFSAAVVEGSVGSEKCLFIKPTTYMNRSGQSVAEAVSFYKVDMASDLLVLVDDLYIPLGNIRIRAGGGTAGHNGLADIQRALGSDVYPRLRIGIDPKPAMMHQADYVLSRFTDEDQAKLGPALDRAAQATEVFITKGLTPAMNQFNTDPDRVKPERPAGEKDGGASRSTPSSN